MFEHFKDLPPTLLGSVLAVFIAAIRVIYDKQETSFIRVTLESVLCGALAFVAGSAINTLGLDQDWALFVGGMIGFVGSQSIKAYADMFVKNKTNAD